MANWRFPPTAAYESFSLELPYYCYRKDLESSILTNIQDEKGNIQDNPNPPNRYVGGGMQTNQTGTILLI